MTSLALVRYKSANIEVKVSGEEDIFGNLPPEIIHKICSSFSTQDLRQVLRCLPKWRKLLNYDSFWKRRCEKKDYQEIEESARTAAYKEFLEKVDNYWQGVYFYNYGLYKNWKENNYEEIRYERNGYAIGTIYYIDEELLVVSNVETVDLIDIRDVKTNKIYHTLKTTFEQGSGPDFQIQRCGRYLCCVFILEGFRIVDAYKGTCVMEYFSEVMEEGVRFYFVIQNKYVIFCYVGFVIRIDLEAEDLIKRDLNYNKEIAFDNDLIAYPFREFVYIANWTNESIIKITCCDKRRTRSLRMKDNLLYIMCEGTGKICIWDIQKKIRINELPNFESYCLTTCFRLHNQQAFEWSHDLNLRVSNFNDDTSFSIESKTTVWSLDINDRFLIIHSEPEAFLNDYPVVKIWCRKTGKFIRSMTYTTLKVRKIWTTNTILMILHVARESRAEMLRVFDYEKKIPLEFP